jgi:hypothetical protein
MGMVWDQGPCIAGGLCLGKEYRQSLYQVVAVVIVPEDLSSFDPTNHHVVQDTGCIEAGLPRHGRDVYILLRLPIDGDPIR